MEKKFNKIFDALRDGNFCWKAANKINIEKKLHKRIFFVSNNNTREMANRDKCYKKLYKENKDFIENYNPSFSPCCYKKVIWICWLQGYESAPDLVKACINSIRINNPDFEIVILTEKNISNYINFPDYIINKYKTGQISRTHFSDILRITLICKYGGVWLDSTVLCTNEDFLNDISSMPIFVFKVMDLNRKDGLSIVASSWLISSFGPSKILLLTRDLLYKYWEIHDYLVDYYIFHIFFSIATKRFPNEWAKIPMYNNSSPHTLMFELNDDFTVSRWDQIIKTSAIHKLTHHVQFDNPNSFYSHILREYDPKDDKKGSEED